MRTDDVVALVDRLEARGLGLDILQQPVQRRAFAFQQARRLLGLELGALLGVGFTLVMRTALLRVGSSASAPLLDPATLALFVASLVLTGVVSGLIPALRAARTDPSEALRAS